MLFTHITKTQKLKNTEEIHLIQKKQNELTGYCVE